MWICGFGYDERSGEYVLADNLCTTCEDADDITLTDRVYDGSPSPDLHLLTRWEVNELRPGKTDRLGRTYTQKMRVMTYRGRKFRYHAGLPLYDRYIRIPRQEKGQEFFFSIDGNFAGDRYLYPDDLKDFIGDYMPDPDSVRTKVRFLSVSEGYDRYLTSLLYMRGKKETPPSETDLVDLYSRDNLPTNIVGGTGIFGAASMQEFPYCKDGSKLNEDNEELISEYHEYSTINGNFDIIREHIYPEHYFEYVCRCHPRPAPDGTIITCHDPLHPAATMNPIEGSPWVN